MVTRPHTLARLIRRLLAFGLIAALTACSNAPVASSAPATSALTEAPASTTTTAPRLDLSDAAPDLADFILTTFDGTYFAGEPALRDALHLLGMPYRPTEVQVGAGVLGSSRIAVVITEFATMGAVNDDSGWRWVAGTVDGTDVYPDLPGVFAVVGSDARPGEDPARARADSIHLVGLDGAGAAHIVGMPRDALAARKAGGQGKINGALSNGGPDSLLWSLEQVAGFSIDGYVLTGFEGFQELVGNVLGAVAITLEAPMSDSASGAFFPEGEVHMNGVEALAYTRNRKGLTTGDFARQLNGGVMLIAGTIAAKVRGPASVPQLLEASERWLVTNLSPEELLELALAVHRLNPLEIDNHVLGGRPSTVNGASVIVLTEETPSVLAGLRFGGG